MERWVGRVALVTGASAGIGAAIAKELVKHGLKVVAIARRVELIEEQKKELSGSKGELHPLKVDLTQEEEILKAFEWIEKHLGGLDILVNNAGVLEICPIIDTPTETWRKILDTNFLAYAICSREAVKSMRKKGSEDGIIININSVSGHVVVPTIEMHSCAKFALKAMTKGLQKELMRADSRIRVMSLSPGYVLTDMAIQHSKIPLSSDNCLVPKDLADCVIFALTMNNNVLITELTIMSTSKDFSMDCV